MYNQNVPGYPLQLKIAMAQKFYIFCDILIFLKKAYAHTHYKIMFSLKLKRKEPWFLL